jgi:hypothetical protein
MTSNRADQVQRLPLPALRIAIAILIALASFLAAAPASAQDPAPFRAIGTLNVTQSRPAAGGTICVGDRVRFEAEVRWDLDFMLAGNVLGNSLTGLTYTAFYDNQLGTVSPASVTARWPRRAANFVFTAQRPGTGAIVFETIVNRDTIFGVEVGGRRLVTTVPIRVEDCAYRVTTISRWAVPGEANIVIRAHMANAGLAYDDTGRLTGTGTMQWEITAGRVGDCTGTVTAFNSAVELAGDVDGDFLILDLEYESALGRIMVFCGFGGPVPIELLPATLTLPIPIQGAGLQTPHQLLRPEPQAGETTILVTRSVPR